MTDDDLNKAYEVVPIEPGPHGPPKGWWTVKRNGLPVRHFPGKEKAQRYATDPAYRASLVTRKAWEKAIADHEEAQRVLLGNLERLREERLARETAAGPMLYPAPGLPDDTPLDNVRFSTRVRNALTSAGWTTVGEIREASDATLLGL